MARQTDPVPYRDITWALREDVHVTLVYHDPNGIRTTYLVSRISQSYTSRNPHLMPWDHALVLDFSDSPFLEINGMVFEEANAEPDLIKWATLTDAVSLSPQFPDAGTCISTRWEGE